MVNQDLEVTDTQSGNSYAFLLREYKFPCTFIFCISQDSVFSTVSNFIGCQLMLTGKIKVKLHESSLCLSFHEKNSILVCI